MDIQSTIRAYQKVCIGFKFEHPATFSESFAQERYNKKMQRPDKTITTALAQKCWSEWLENDNGLPEVILPPGVWYRVRLVLHRLYAKYHKQFVKFDRFRLPAGSEFVSTRGANSAEARLCQSVWTCTYDNFWDYSRVVYGSRDLRVAAKKRFAKWAASKDIDIGEFNRELYNRYWDLPRREIAFNCFRDKLRLITQFEQGSRFATVPKNNEKRRPINIECFGNTLTQSVIGEAIRFILKAEFNIDLDTLADLHGQKISDADRWATIDLKNASDSISCSLCKFLLPTALYDKLEASRSTMVLGYDGNYHITKKISSMGNGFTFELMTLILTLVCREFDQESTVFGDDIIIHPSKADDLIAALTAVGLKVNKEKSFITGPFRESCGANFHVDEGYIASFDFEYPQTMSDCVVIHNKAYLLARDYPSFKKLYNTFLRALPPALHGGCYDVWDPTLGPKRNHNLRGRRITYNIPSFFVTPFPAKRKITSPRIADSLSAYGYNPDQFYMVFGFEIGVKNRSEMLKNLNPRRHWAKYFMYLRANRRTPDVLTGTGFDQKIAFITDGSRVFRAQAITRPNFRVV